MSKSIKTSSKGENKRMQQSKAAPPPDKLETPAKSSAANYRSATTMVILLGVVLVISAILNFVAGKGSDFREPVDISLQEPDILHLGTGNADYNADGVPDVIYYPSPNLSSKDQNFCKGAGKADSCSERPIHPLYESMRLLGTPVPEKERQRKYTDKQTQRRFWFFD